MGYEQYKEFLKEQTTARVRDEIVTVRQNVAAAPSARSAAAWKAMQEIAESVLKAKEGAEK